MKKIISLLFIIVFIVMNVTVSFANETKWVSEDGSSRLTLTKANKRYLSGTFYHNNVGIKFMSYYFGNMKKFSVSFLDGTPITSFSESNENIRFNYLGERHVAVFDKKFLNVISIMVDDDVKKRYSDSSIKQHLNQYIETKGSQNAVNDMYDLAEVSIIPKLSQILGEKLGYNGKAYPSALPLHIFALTTSKKLNIQIIMGNENLSTKSNESDNCYGLCGIGCSCWTWVCGDCEYNHPGCFCHDYFCRQSLAHPLCNLYWYIPFYDCGGCN
jgi:DNA-binding protein Fis